MGRSRRLIPVLLAVVVLGASAWLLWPRDSLRIRRVTDPSAELQAGIQEARRRLPEFDRMLTASKRGDRMAVRARFATPEGNEYLWLRDPILAKDRDGQPIYVGLVDQRPLFLKKKQGDAVAVGRADVVDWLARAGGKTVGGFTQSGERR